MVADFSMMTYNIHNDIGDNNALTGCSSFHVCEDKF